MIKHFYTNLTLHKIRKLHFDQSFSKWSFCISYLNNEKITFPALRRVKSGSVHLRCKVASDA